MKNVHKQFVASCKPPHSAELVRALATLINKLSVVVNYILQLFTLVYSLNNDQLYEAV